MLPTLDYAVTLPEAETGTIVDTARSHRPQAQLGCGLAEFRAGRFPQAANHLRDRVAAYPGDPGADQARSVLVAADVTVPGCPSCPRTVSPVGTCPSPAGKPMQTVRLTSGLYHVLLRPTGSRSRNVRTLTAVDGDGFCVYAVPAGALT